MRGKHNSSKSAARKMTNMVGLCVRKNTKLTLGFPESTVTLVGRHCSCSCCMLESSSTTTAMKLIAAGLPSEKRFPGECVGGSAAQAVWGDNGFLQSLITTMSLTARWCSGSWLCRVIPKISCSGAKVWTTGTGGVHISRIFFCQKLGSQIFPPWGWQILPKPDGDFSYPSNSFSKLIWKNSRVRNI